jgi:hypothetical protein
MPRVLELFAKRGLVPQQWRSTVSHAGLAIEVEIAGLDDELAEYIARTMRQIIGVETVLSGEVGSEYKTGHAYLRSGGKAEHASCQRGSDEPGRALLRHRTPAAGAAGGQR